MEFKHVSVLLNESIEGLNIKENGIYVDGTAGGAGHSIEIAKKLQNGKLIAIDRDPDAVTVAKERLKNYNAEVCNANFSEFTNVLSDLNIENIDGFLLDLGVSSYQLDNAERGFSYHTEAPLDMRMSKAGTSAADLVNNLSEFELSKILRDYGEERFCKKIAHEIVKRRPIYTTTELADVISSSVPAAARREGHPARKSFQALRIAVNGELEIISSTINKAFSKLNVGGRIAVITFHSLEDRIVKRTFLELCSGCTCPSDFPVCVCGKTPNAILVNKKPITATDKELSENSRSRSAKLRILEKIKEGK